MELQMHLCGALSDFKVTTVSSETINAEFPAIVVCEGLLLLQLIFHFLLLLLRSPGTSSALSLLRSTQLGCSSWESWYKMGT